MVVDASAAVLALLNRGTAREHLSAETLVAPHLVDSEVAHALRAQVRRGDVAVGDAAAALDRWAGLGIERFGVTGLLGRVWELRDNLTAYDATYVAVAESLGCELLTADRKMARAVGPTCPITVVDS